MSLRRAHQKSKFGCTTCKKRRIKCDLGRPDCKNCTRRGVECSFRISDPAPRSCMTAIGQADSSNKLSLQLHTSLLQSPPSPTFIEGLLDGLPDVLRPRFKQLLHHFANQTSATISHNAQAQVTWCAAVPQLTASHEFVLKGIFSITALHLSRKVTVETERKHLRYIADAQMNTGLIRYRAAVGNVTAENAEALFAYGVTLLVFTLLASAEECHHLLQFIGSGSQQPSQRRAAMNELVLAITNFMRCQTGMRVVIVPCWHLLARGMLSPIVNRDWWPHRIPLSPQAIEEDRKLQNIEYLWMQPGRRYEYWFEILRQALQKLREDFALISQLIAGNNTGQSHGSGPLFDWSPVMSWPVEAPSEFTNLLEQRKPEAWVILAHYAILPSKADEIWWIKNLAPNIVSTAALVLEKDMWTWIEWPASVTGVNLNNLLPPFGTLTKVGVVKEWNAIN